MKKSHLKLILFQLCMIFVMFFYSFVLSNNISMIARIIFWVISFLILKFSLGFEKDKSIIKKDILIEVFIFVFGYLILEYLLGLFIGFVRNPYNLSLMGMIKNIIPVAFLIIIEELCRYIFIIKGKGYKGNNLLVLLVFVVYDVVISFKLYNIFNGIGFFNFVTLIVFTSISKNFLLNYISKISGYKPCLLYRYGLELIIYIVPIFTNLGDYLSAIFKIVFPLILFLRISNFIKVNDNKEYDRGILSKVSLVVLSSILLCLISLTSNVFKYYILVIASNSMAPNINLGDAVIVEKINNLEIDKININDILVYRYDNKIIVHRVINIFNLNNRYVFQTKGDNNVDYDEWLIYEENVIGVVKNRLIGIGYPSVYLNQFINN